jgi:hypothetical protein
MCFEERVVADDRTLQEFESFVVMFLRELESS